MPVEAAGLELQTLELALREGGCTVALLARLQPNGMTFLNPLVLFGLVAAAIPLLIHLFNFRRPKRIEFSSLVFLRELQKTTMQRVKIKQWLLLILRTLAIACLVLAFARPSLTGTTFVPGAESERAVAVVIDNTPSMTLRDADGQYLDQALEAGRHLAELIDPGDEFSIVTQAGEAPSLEHRSAAAASGAVREIGVQLSARTLADAVSEAIQVVKESDLPGREVYVLSDLQRSTFGDFDSGLDLRGLTLSLIPIGRQGYANVAVRSIGVDSRIVRQGEPVRFVASVVNFGDGPVDGLVVSVYLEGERAAQASISLAPFEVAEVPLVATARQGGWIRGYAEIESDAFEYDDRRYFSFQVPERRRILFVQGGSHDARYLQLALSEQFNGLEGSFSVETVEEDGLSAVRPGGFDAILLSGPTSLSSGEAARLSEYVAAGGGLFVFAGAAGTVGLNGLLERLGAGRLLEMVGESAASEVVAVADRYEVEHPLFEGVFEESDDVRSEIERPEVYRFATYEPRSGFEQTLIRLSNGRPFLQEIRYGEGAVLLIPTLPDPEWTDLPRRGLFVPLLFRSLFYLSSAEVEGGEVVIGRGGQIRLVDVRESETVHAVGPDGFDFVPHQRATFGALLVDFDARPYAPGLYDLVAGDRLLRRVAFNLDENESDLRRLEVGEAADVIENGTGARPRTPQVLPRSRSDIEQTVAQARSGVELWKTFLLLATLFMIAEMIVARQWRPEAGS
jgi:hypothetical protein